MIAPGRDCADILRLALAKVEGESRVRSMIDAGEPTAKIFEKIGIM